jgi:hypothetical protein
MLARFLANAQLGEYLHRNRLGLDGQFDRAIFELAGFEAGPHLFARALLAFVFLGLVEVRDEH